MDAVEFLKIYKRMCENNSRFLQINLSRADFESMVSDTEQWAKDHPIKTRQSEFLKLFPKAHIDGNEILTVMPCDIDAEADVKDENGDCRYEYCFDCRKAYWLQEE